MFKLNKIPFYLGNAGLLKWMPDKAYLKFVFRSAVGYPLNLENPKTFSEKLQWLKLYDRKPEYTAMVDKYAAKEYVGGKIGEQYIIPTLGVWDDFNAIDFAKLPDRFVLKCTHDSGGVVICTDKAAFDMDKARKKINRSLKQNYFYGNREWPYKNVKPRIIAEEFIEDGSGKDLKDFKFYCFHGKPLYCQVISDRFTAETIDFFDMEWKHQPFNGLSFPGEPYEKNSTDIKKPYNFDQMKNAAEKLSEGLVFSRIDFYEVKDKMFFGEITFYPASGFGVFTPKEWDKYLGDRIQLPLKETCN